MQDASMCRPARFRPTWQQAFGRGLYLGAVVAAVLLAVAAIVSLASWTGAGPAMPRAWIWPVLAVAPPLIGLLSGVLVGRRLGTDIDDRGIRTVSAFTRAVQPWSRVVDLRAERRGARTVVSVYLDTGVSVQLRAPYDGELFAADPQFEMKVFELSHLWRSHRFGGLAG
jgi:hypothetical protein